MVCQRFADAFSSIDKLTGFNRSPMASYGLLDSNCTRLSAVAYAVCAFSLVLRHTFPVPWELKSRKTVASNLATFIAPMPTHHGLFQCSEDLSLFKWWK